MATGLPLFQPANVNYSLSYNLKRKTNKTINKIK
jgi:hypothetical protein